MEATDKIIVNYRHGYPTKKAINALIEAFLGERDSHRIYVARYQGTDTLWWHYKYINNKIDGFCAFLKEYDIEVESIELFESPRTGNLKIKKKLV